MKLHIINKRVLNGLYKLKKPSKNIRFSLGTIALIFCCLILLIIAAFTHIKYNFNFSELNPNYNFRFEYIPQIPAVIFISALMGIRWGFLTVLLYVTLGLTPWFPIFGMGGGFSYIFQYTFGYILAFVFASFFTAKEIQHKNSFINYILAVFYGVFIIHIIGIFYMFLIAVLKHNSFYFIYDLIYYQSLSKILYDLLFSIIFIIIAKYLKKILWIITG